MEPFKKCVICLMELFTPFNYFSHFVNFTLTLPLCYSLHFTENYRMRERKVFLYMAASTYHVISKEVKTHIL